MLYSMCMCHLLDVKKCTLPRDTVYLNIKLLCEWTHVASNISCGYFCIRKVERMENRLMKKLVSQCMNN